MKAFVNFYENLKEALIRLRNTIVMYDNLPYYVLAITNHADGILRMYLLPIGNGHSVYSIPEVEAFPPEHPTIPVIMDKYMLDKPEVGIIRKQMNSPLFKKFRPYPLGMCNTGGATYYIERQPNRKSEQGLTKSMMYFQRVSAGLEKQVQLAGIDILSPAFRSCILGEHPPADICLTAMLDPCIDNEAVAFHRSFALIRGPIDMLFLAYKEDVIGVLPHSDFSLLRVGRDFKHIIEVVEELSLFNVVTSQ